MADFSVEIAGGARHDSIEEAQQAAMQALAAAIARAVRAGLESGRYIVRDGVVILSNSPTIPDRRN